MVTRYEAWQSPSPRGILPSELGDRIIEVVEIVGVPVRVIMNSVIATRLEVGCEPVTEVV